MSRYRAAFTLSLVLATAGCGPELLGGAQDGEVRTVATSDESGSSASAPAGAGPSTTAGQDDQALPAGGPSRQQTGESIEGEVHFDGSVFLITEDGDAVPLTNGVVQGTFEIAGDDEVLIGRTDVEARRYTGVRMVFTRVEAIVSGGLLVGGAPIVGLVTVDLGATRTLVVERQVDITVEGRTTQTLVVDLDAHEWLPATVLPGSFVAGHVFAAAVDVRMR